MGFTQSHSEALGDIEGFYQFIPGTYRGDKPINSTGIDKIHLKCDCIQGSLVNGCREPILNFFDLDQPPRHKICKTPRMKHFTKTYKSARSHITFY